MPPIVSICAVAQTPPPIHGQSAMNRLLLDGSYRRVRLLHVRMAFSEKIEEVAEFQWSKIAHLFSVTARVIWIRIRFRAPTLYYPPASPNMVPFLRDCAILISTRWMFRRTVFHFHANGISELYPRLRFPLKLLYRLAYSNPDLCICLTRHGTADARHFGSREIAVVPNGIPDVVRDGKRAMRNEGGVPTILFLAAVSREKGAGVFLEALSILVSRKLAFRGVVAGPFLSAAEERDLRALAASRDLDDRISWSGPLEGDAKWAMYGGADIFCFPSHYSSETFGLVLVEAMMFSLPVVSTHWRGIPDVVADGTTGFLVPTHDPVAVADRLEQLLNDRVLRETMGAAGRRRFEENFTVERFRENMERALAGDEGDEHGSPGLLHAETPGLRRKTVCGMSGSGPESELRTIPVIPTPLALTNYEGLSHFLLDRARQAGAFAVDFSNTQIVTMRRHEPEFRELSGCMDLCVPDGMPLVWALNFRGAGLDDRVYGPTFTRRFLGSCPADATHYLVGGSAECGDKFRERMRELNPSLRFGGGFHGKCSADGILDDDERVLAEILALQPDFIWVGLGTPKQYAWIARIKPLLSRGVLLAVGFAFDVNAGMKGDAPMWMQKRGLTWLYRMASEPGRLGGRYLKWNTLFLWYLLAQGGERKA